MQTHPKRARRALFAVFFGALLSPLSSATDYWGVTSTPYGESTKTSDSSGLPDVDIQLTSEEHGYVIRVDVQASEQGHGWAGLRVGLTPGRSAVGDVVSLVSDVGQLSTETRQIELNSWNVQVGKPVDFYIDDILETLEVGDTIYCQGLFMEGLGGRLSVSRALAIQKFEQKARQTRLSFDPDLSRMLVRLAMAANLVNATPTSEENDFQKLSFGENPIVEVNRRLCYPHLPGTYQDGWRTTDVIHSPAGSPTDTEMFIARNDGWNELAVVFRGSEDHSFESGGAYDWINNASAIINTDGIHLGFATAYGAVEDQLAEALRDQLQTVAHPETAHVYFTGHSLGGALATVAAYKWVEELAGSWGIPRENVIMYSYGAPRSLSILDGLDFLFLEPGPAMRYAQAIPNAYAIAKANDPVTHLPVDGLSVTTALLPYSHIPNLIVLDEEDSNLPPECGPGAEWPYYGEEILPLPDPEDHYVSWRMLSGPRLDLDLGLTEGSCLDLSGGALTPCHGNYVNITDAMGDTPTTQPKLSLGVSASGTFILRWTKPSNAHSLDWVGLYKGHPYKGGFFVETYDNFTPGGVLNDYLFGSGWEYVSEGTSHETDWARGYDYHAVYFDRLYGRIGGISDSDPYKAGEQPYLPKKPSLAIVPAEIWPLTFVGVTWTNNQPGKWDYVAIYDGYPKVGEHYFGEFDYAIDDDQMITSKFWDSGYYAAYVVEDDFGDERILAVAGPSVY